jgi:outer membrane lipase/esterase
VRALATNRGANVSRPALAYYAGIVCLGFGGAALLSSSAQAESLDDAVARQLEVVGPDVCARLLNGDSVAVLRGALVDICTRGIPAGGAGGSDSGGGGAATPSTVPEVVQKRMARGSEPHPDAEQATQSERAEAETELPGDVGVFFSAEYERLDREVTGFEDGYDSDLARATLGADRRFGDSLVAGIAVNGSGQWGDFDGGGNFDQSSIGALGFAAFSPLDPLMLEANAGYAHTFYDRKRAADFTQLDSGGAVDFTTSGRPEGDFDSEAVYGGALASYDVPIRNVTLSPQAGVDFHQLFFDSYRESGNSGLELEFRDDDQTFLQSRLGTVVSAAFSAPFGVIVPHASFDWKHEFLNDQRNVKVSFVGDTRGRPFHFETDDPDRDFFLVGAGISAVLPHGFQAFVSYRAMVGHSFFDGHAATIGVRGSF